MADTCLQHGRRVGGHVGALDGTIARTRKETGTRMATRKTREETLVWILSEHLQDHVPAGGNAAYENRSHKQTLQEQERAPTCKYGFEDHPAFGPFHN
jgi:hypothetical protein